MTEDRWQKTDDRGQMTEVRRQRTEALEVGSRNAEVGRGKTDPSSLFELRRGKMRKSEVGIIEGEKLGR